MFPNCYSDSLQTPLYFFPIPSPSEQTCKCPHLTVQQTHALRRSKQVHQGHLSPAMTRHLSILFGKLSFVFSPTVSRTPSRIFLFQELWLVDTCTDFRHYPRILQSRLFKCDSGIHAIFLKYSWHFEYEPFSKLAWVVANRICYMSICQVSSNIAFTKHPIKPYFKYTPLTHLLRIVRQWETLIVAHTGIQNLPQCHVSYILRFSGPRATFKVLLRPIIRSYS